MKRLVPWFFAAILFLGAASVRAQFTWVGNGATGALLSDPGNWSGGIAPTGVGGTEDLVFNYIAGAPQTTIIAPTSAFRNISFKDFNRPAYTVNGTGGAVVTLYGTLLVEAGSLVTFSNSLGLALSTGSHTFDIASGATVQLNSNITGVGGLTLASGGSLNLTGVNTYAGGTILNSGALAIDSGSLTHGSANMVVGQNSGDSADLMMANGGDLTNATGTIANLAGSFGYVSVTGAGSTWTNNTYLYVGAAGTGNLDITVGGVVTSPNISIGNNTGGQGSVLVDGTGSQLNIASTVYAGSLGYGELYVNNGASLTSTTGSIGNNAGGGGGVVSLSNPGSTWTNSGAILVGNATQGALDAQDHSGITTNTISVGVLTGVTGSVLVSDGSSLTSTGDFTAGASGQGTVGIDMAGAITTGGTAHLGVSNGSLGSVFMAGTGSTWTINQDLNIGESGVGQMFVTSDAILNVAGVVRLGVNTGGSGILYLGYDGEGYGNVGTLNVSTITTGAGTGSLVLGNNGSVSSPYYLTTTGLAGGTNIAVIGATSVQTINGYSVILGTNTYTGGTMIYPGSTLVAGSNSALGSGAVNLNGGRLNVANGVTLSNTLNFVSTGNVLGGTGTFGSNVTVDSKVTLSPGNSPGTLSFTNGLTFAGGGSLNFEVQAATGAAGTGYDLISVSGALLSVTATSGSPFTIHLISLNSGGGAGNVSDFTASSGYSWTLLTSSAGISGFSPANFVIDATSFSNSLGAGGFSLVQSGNNILLNFSPVPEPSTWVLLLAGLSGFALRFRRRA